MPEKTKKTTKKKKYEYEYCAVCKLNHDQGPNHKYIPTHTKSLSAVLSRFQAKLSDVRLYLRNPAPLRREHADRTRLWCVFCDADIDDLDSSFACSSNAINHLANAEHLKNLKHFLWKYGGGMDRIETFRISEDDLAMWEKKCESLKSEAVPSVEGSRGPTIGPSNDIHNEMNYGIIDNFQNNSNSSFPNGVMPLLYHTNEYQVSRSGLPQVINVGCLPQDVTTTSLRGETCSASYSVSSNGLAGFQNLTQISRGFKEASGNVHSEAPPPWLEADEAIQFSVPLKPVISMSNESGKSKKLNPKRVGAAWAERRKREMETEKRGEIVKSDCDANWLPNFGRVWQSGSRKESKKEFELEKQKLPKVESQSEMPIKIQPYVSKRMRTDASE